ncbi:MAG: TIGR03936 family radical SAM-associated protein [Clostridia bacterium]|nr:TIGR03936 family radical SAM-associated protein [Clostridia bacterium]
MLNVKFKKTAEAVYISHIDVQNAINRTIRRAGYEPRLSEGFHPHTILKLSPPLPLGIESHAEYFTLYLDGIPCDEFVETFHSNAPRGLVALHAVKTETYPNLAGNIVASDYLIRDKRLRSLTEQLGDFIRAGFIVKHRNKDGIAEKCVSELIYDHHATEDGLRVKLAAGNITLRADRFVEALNGYFDLDIISTAILRTAQYVAKDKGLMDVDDYLADLRESI